MNAFRRAKEALATPFMRRLLRRPGIFPVRRDLSYQYLRGSGVEFGAMNAPLPVSDGVTVKYADLGDFETLKASYSKVASIQTPDIISDLETMHAIENESQNFIIANHVLEHVENPIKAVRSMMRVMRVGGIAYVTLPEKNYTFDKRRALTPLDHLIRDYLEGPGWSRREHYLDWATNVDHLSGVAAERRVDHLMSVRQNIHFHVWDQDSMKKMFCSISEFPEIRFKIERSQFNRSEVIWILRKEA
jgi:ubiquinone/menaquinone biosynthesis C-methylase UbiE